MAQTHVASGQKVSVLPLGGDLHSAKTSALLKSTQLEVVRLVLRAGRGLPEHRFPGEITVLCIEGHIAFTTPAQTCVLEPGDFIHLQADEPHALEAMSDASALVTMRLPS